MHLSAWHPLLECPSVESILISFLASSLRPHLHTPPALPYRYPYD